jgi:glucokinase
MIRKYILALDIGGTNITGARYTHNLEELETEKISCEAGKGKDVVLKNIFTVIDALINEQTLAIALAWAGFVDSQSGIIQKSPNIPGFEGVHIAKILSDKFQLPVYIENDTKLFAYAEQQILYPHSKTFLGIIMGTGLGCGIVLNGNIFKGSNGNAGELGHAMFIPPFCESNEIEKFFTGKGLAKRVYHLTRIQSLEKLGEALVLQEQHVIKKLTPIVEEISIWLYGLILTFDADTIIFGGGVGKNIMNHLLPIIEENIAQKFHMVRYPYSTKLAVSQILNSGLVGAGILARNNS